MKPLDKFLQFWRIKKVKHFIPRGSRVLDIGCADGMLYRLLKSHITEYVGIDPLLSQSVGEGAFSLIPGWFPKDLPEMPPFDAITMLAVIEHLPAYYQRETALACDRFLREDGILILTSPSPMVEKLLNVMIGLHIADGMSLEEHYGFDVDEVPRIFGNMELIRHNKFQFGLNHLFVFKKI